MVGIEVEFTDYCNLRCKMCDQYFKNGKPHDLQPIFMSFNTWKKILSHIRELNRKVDLSISWLGESLLHPKFNEFLNYAFKKPAFNTLTLITNGTVMDDSKIKTILDCSSLSENTFRKIHISIDAFTLKTYKKIKGKDLLRDVNNNVIQLLDSREKKHLQYPKIILSFIVMKENLNEVRPFYNKWKKIFKKYGINLDVNFDWPNEKDSIYFRRLNSNNFKENDTIHKMAANELGINKTRKHSSL